MTTAGGASVGYSLTTDVVKKACKGLDKDTNTEMMWYYIEKIPDLNKTQIFIFTPLVISILFFGVYPDPLFTTIDVSINNLIEKYQTNIDFYLTQKK